MTQEHVLFLNAVVVLGQFIQLASELILCAHF